MLWLLNRFRPIPALKLNARLPAASAYLFRRRYTRFSVKSARRRYAVHFRSPMLPRAQGSRLPESSNIADMLMRESNTGAAHIIRRATMMAAVYYYFRALMLSRVIADRLPSVYFESAWTPGPANFRHVSSSRDDFA